MVDLLATLPCAIFSTCHPCVLKPWLACEVMQGFLNKAPYFLLGICLMVSWMSSLSKCCTIILAVALQCKLLLTSEKNSSTVSVERPLGQKDACCSGLVLRVHNMCNCPHLPSMPASACRHRPDRQKSWQCFWRKQFAAKNLHSNHTVSALSQDVNTTVNRAQQNRKPAHLHDQQGSLMPPECPGLCVQASFICCKVWGRQVSPNVAKWTLAAEGFHEP